MKLASFSVHGRDAFGIVRDDGVIDLTRHTDARSLRECIGRGLQLMDEFQCLNPDYMFDEVVWLPPIRDPMHIIGIGLNTRSHFAETTSLMNRVAGDYPNYPRLFMRSPHSLVAHGGNIILPEVSEQLDYEGEIALVIGKRCRNVSLDDAMGCVAGITAVNDGSVRDYQFHSSQTTAGKNFHASGAIGPYILTLDEISDLSALVLRTKVNGEIRQTLEMSDMIFSFSQLIHYISQIFLLEAGDIILTGSPAGIGGLDGNWLRPGDQVEIEIEQLGILRNTVVAQSC